MAKIGIKRQIDSLGRICIPKEMRELYNLKKTVELIVTEEGVLIRNPEYFLKRIEDDKEKQFF